MESREQFLSELLQLNPNLNIDIIRAAYDKSVEVHEGQFRKSGEPYLVHPVAVAKILADLGMDDQTIVAGLKRTEEGVLPTIIVDVGLATIDIVILNSDVRVSAMT